MQTIITGSSPLLLAAREARAKLASVGGNEKLLAKFDALLSKNNLHGGEQLKLEALIKQAGEV